MKKKAKIVFGKLNLLRNDQLNNKNKIKIGFVGGGPNSFIGYTHRLAARFDNRFDFVAGVFSKDKKKSKEFGKSLGLDPDRCYNDYKSMAKNESLRPDGVQAIGIMTPSGDHYKIAKEFIKKNVHIICDKPLTSTVEDAIALEKLVYKTKIVFALTHNYSSYPMLREAKKLVEKNKIGIIKLINVEYPQGYTVGVKKKDEKSTLKWRLDKNMCGPSMILAEIGTHAYHLMRYVTGLEVKEVSAEVNSLSDEISLDDNAFMTVRMNNKARGSIWVSSAATGGENGLKIRVYGTKGAVEWLQDDPNILKFTELNSSTQIITRASDAVSDLSIQSSRVAAGHPEGFFEAFANIYTEFADSIQANLKKNKIKLVHPSVNDGVMGIKFIFAAKKSSNLNSKWIKI
ncbi:Gfo/Idh/MocA family oxidoreductase [Pelagibacteraceae bacterium]|nr:Gfo/Idh/MocA family oxidoreductase [Pelagibacteraceae bacterium]